MGRYAAGDEAAFAELYDLLSQRLFAYLLQRTRDPELAQDLLQQTLLQVHRARGSFIAGADVMPWVFAIARRLVIDSARQSHRRSEVSDEGEALTLAADSAPADDFLHARQLASQLEVALLDLPAPQRAAFELQKRDGLSLGEVAKILDITVGAVKLRLHRAQQALRAALSRLEKIP